MIVYPIADTHGHLPDPKGVPSNSVILHAGDLCPNFNVTSKTQDIALQAEWLDTVFREWLWDLYAKVTVIITPGNHDFVFEAGRHRELGEEWPDWCHILIDRSMWVKGIGLVHGTPWCYSPVGWAYRLQDEAAFRDLYHYTLPVRPMDVWLTHQPPLGPAGQVDGHNIGSGQTHHFAQNLKTRVVITGHAHEGAGLYKPTAQRPYLLINAAVCDPLNKPVRGWTAVDIGEPYGGEAE